MTTATQKYTGKPKATLDGAERMVGDNASDGETRGFLTQQIADLFKGTKGTDIASATTTDIAAATGLYVHITGTTTITGLGTPASGNPVRVVTFDGSLTLTHNATSLILPTAGNIQTVAGDCAVFAHESGANWRCVAYQRKSGQPLSSAVNTVTSSSGVLNLDLAKGDYFKITLTENVTSLTFSNLPPAGVGRTIMLEITQHASSPKTFAFPSTLKWAGGAAPSISSANSKVDVLAMTTFDQGTTYRSTLAKDFS